MAITWRTKISVLDIKRKNVSVILEQIDDTDSENIKVLNTYSILEALINTPEQKQQIFSGLERQYIEKKQKQAEEEMLIGTLIKDINNVAKNWETK